MKIANRKIAIMLVSMVSLPIIQSTNATPTSVSAQQLSSAERAYLAQLIEQATAHTRQLSAQLHAFFDTTGNREPYDAHVRGFKTILDSVDYSMISQLEAEMQNTRNA